MALVPRFSRSSRHVSTSTVVANMKCRSGDLPAKRHPYWCRTGAVLVLVLVLVLVPYWSRTFAVLVLVLVPTRRCDCQWLAHFVVRVVKANNQSCLPPPPAATGRHQYRSRSAKCYCFIPFHIGDHCTSGNTPFHVRKETKRRAKRALRVVHLQYNEAVGQFWVASGSLKR